MTYAPQTLVELSAYWKAHDGVPLGIVGDVAHQEKGTSYHLGRDDLAPLAYSRRTARDRAGLSNAASAIDLGRLDDSLTELWDFSAWFAGKCQQDDPAYRDVREVIFWSPTRGRVVGWSDLAPKGLINDYGDGSHRTHTHISFYRDSEARPKSGLFAPYFNGGDPSMIPVLSSSDGSFVVPLPYGLQLYDSSFKPLIKVSKAQDADGFFGTGTGYYGVAVVTGGTRQLVFVKSSQVTPVPRGDAQMYAVTVGGKPAGEVELP